MMYNKLLEFKALTKCDHVTRFLFYALMDVLTVMSGKIVTKLTFDSFIYEHYGLDAADMKMYLRTYIYTYIYFMYLLVHL